MRVPQEHLSIAPLRYPQVWPPPDMSPVPFRFLLYLPIVRWIIYGVLSMIHFGKHHREVLQPIEEQICQQLAARPPKGDWPVSIEQRQIAQIISQVISEEKNLDSSPALCPEDPFQLLFLRTRRQFESNDCPCRTQVAIEY